MESIRVAGYTIRPWGAMSPVDGVQVIGELAAAQRLHAAAAERAASSSLPEAADPMLVSTDAVKKLEQAREIARQATVAYRRVVELVVVQVPPESSPISDADAMQIAAGWSATIRPLTAPAPTPAASSQSPNSGQP